MNENSESHRFRSRRCSSRAKLNHEKNAVIRPCNHTTDNRTVFVWYLALDLGGRLGELREQSGEYTVAPIIDAVSGCVECHGFALQQEPRRPTDH